MNANKRVFLFVFLSLSIYVLVSLASYQYGFYWKPFDKVNLLADIVSADGERGKVSPDSGTKTDGIPPQLLAQDSLLGLSDMLDSIETLPKPTDSNASDSVNTPQKSVKLAKDAPIRQLPDSIKQFVEIHAPKELIASSGNLKEVALPNVMEKLHALQSAKHQKLRIAYLGDSMIEGDLLSQTLRSLLQKEFGGRGVGFVPLTSPAAQFRQTATTTGNPSLKDVHFKNSKRGNFFFNGHIFFAKGDDSLHAPVHIRDNTYKDTSILVSKHLLYGKADSTSHIGVNGKEMELPVGKLFNKRLLSKDKGRNVRFASLSPDLPVYGISFESDNGVFVDNFSFRGISGLEFGQLKPDFMRQIDQTYRYDLIIIQFGVNVLYSAEDTNFNWYKKLLVPVIKRMKESFPDSDFLVVSSSDRAFFYDDEYRSAKGIQALVDMQAEIAYLTGCAFYNQFEAMGGENSIVAWANQVPSLANKDYVHPNGKGMKILGTYLYEAFMKDLGKRKPTDDRVGEEVD